MPLNLLIGIILSPNRYADEILRVWRFIAKRIFEFNINIFDIVEWSRNNKRPRPFLNLYIFSCQIFTVGGARDRVGYCWR